MLTQLSLPPLPLLRTEGSCLVVYITVVIILALLLVLGGVPEGGDGLFTVLSDVSIRQRQLKIVRRKLLTSLLIVDETRPAQQWSAATANSFLLVTNSRHRLRNTLVTKARVTNARQQKKQELVLCYFYFLLARKIGTGYATLNLRQKQIFIFKPTSPDVRLLFRIFGSVEAVRILKQSRCQDAAQRPWSKKSP